MQITLSSDALWSMLQSLSPDTKRWLGEKLIEESRKDAPCQYTVEEMKQRLQQVETRILQGDPGFSNEEVEAELLEDMPWLAGLSL